jgi:chromosome segregation ATPase
LAVLTVIYGFANGYFQATATKLENQRHDLQVEKNKLEAEVKEFTARKEELERTIAEQQETLEAIIAAQKEQLSVSNSIITSQRNALMLCQDGGKRAASLMIENENLKKEIDRLKQHR